MEAFFSREHMSSQQVRRGGPRPSEAADVSADGARAENGPQSESMWPTAQSHSQKKNKIRRSV